MATFKYKARDKFAKPVSGTTAALDRDGAAKKLKDMGYLPISVVEIHEFPAAEILKRFKSVKSEELDAFTRQLYILQKAGVPLLASLQAIALQQRNQYFKTVIEDVTADIKGGLSFSESLKKHNRVFDEIYVSMIKVAETGGLMTDILGRLSSLLQQQIDTRSRVKAATKYPMIALLTLGLGFFILVIFVIPRFAAVYSQFNAQLPLPTRILIATNTAIKNFWYLFIPGILVLIYGFSRFIGSSLGRPLWDSFKLNVPVFGNLVTMLIMSRFARVTAISMKSGVPILEVLSLVAKTSNNVIIGRAIENIRENVKGGKGISEPMKISGLFPPVVIQMVAIGEQTGKVDELLLSVADYYDLESGYMIRNLTTYIEPLLIFVLGIMVLILALGIFMPMWNLIKIFNPS